jgi:hypothetical protein
MLLNVVTTLRQLHSSFARIASHSNGLPLYVSKAVANNLSQACKTGYPACRIAQPRTADAAAVAAARQQP